MDYGRLAIDGQLVRRVLIDGEVNDCCGSQAGILTTSECIYFYINYLLTDIIPS